MSHSCASAMMKTEPKKGWFRKKITQNISTMFHNLIFRFAKDFMVAATLDFTPCITFIVTVFFSGLILFYFIFSNFFFFPVCGSQVCLGMGMMVLPTNGCLWGCFQCIVKMIQLVFFFAIFADLMRIINMWLCPRSFSSLDQIRFYSLI